MLTQHTKDFYNFLTKIIHEQMMKFLKELTHLEKKSDLSQIEREKRKYEMVMGYKKFIEDCSNSTKDRVDYEPFKNTIQWAKSLLNESIS